MHAPADSLPLPMRNGVSPSCVALPHQGEGTMLDFLLQRLPGVGEKEWRQRMAAGDVVVRVTYSDGFDGLPVPSPDGKQIAFTSARSGGGAGQIFLAQWNHEAALRAIQAAPPRKN